MARIKVRHLKLRDGRPCWEPSPSLRKAGWPRIDFKDDAGNWMPIGDAMLAAEKINAEIDAWRAAGKKRRKTPVPQKHPHSCRALFEHWYRSADFQKLKPRTQADYKAKAEHFLALFGEHHVKAVTKPHLVAFWQKCYDQRGHHMANGIKAVYSAAFSYAELIGWREPETNPALKMKRPKPAARVVLWLPDELNAMVAAADELGVPSVADAIIIGLHSGQRLSDVLDMPQRIFTEERIKLTQFKRGALIDAPMTPQCQARMHLIRERQRAAAVVSMATIIVSEATGSAYTPRSFNTAFRAVRDRAAITAPGVTEKNYQDLRDTAVTRLALAGSTMPQIAAITGHALPSITQIMKHYLALQPEMADEAIRKLTAWMQTHNIAI